MRAAPSCRFMDLIERQWDDRIRVFHGVKSQQRFSAARFTILTADLSLVTLSSVALVSLISGKFIWFLLLLSLKLVSFYFFIWQ